MPWEARTIIAARREFVALAQSPDANIRALCRRFNVSATTAYELLKRFQVEGEKGLYDRSRRPRHIALRSSEATEQAVLSVRADHPTWGARKIARQLRLLGATVVPAASTITAILARHGRLGSVDETDGRQTCMTFLNCDSWKRFAAPVAVIARARRQSPGM